MNHIKTNLSDFKTSSSAVLTDTVHQLDELMEGNESSECKEKQLLSQTQSSINNGLGSIKQVSIITDSLHVYTHV